MQGAFFKRHPAGVMPAGSGAKPHISPVGSVFYRLILAEVATGDPHPSESARALLIALLSKVLLRYSCQE